MPPRTFALLGYPLGHSFSKRFFNDKFLNEGIDAKYINWELPSLDDLQTLIYSTPNICGFNVTIPYKEKIIKYLDEISPEAQEIGAVNVVKVIKNESNKTRLIGFNTDIIGFCDSISPLLTSHHQKALVLGTGGASKAIVSGLRKLGIESKLVSRHASETTLTYNNITSEIISTHKVIINTTPLGMHPNVDTYPKIPYCELGNNHVCFDLVYNPQTTEFMRKCAKNGAIVKGGIEMLHLQALAAWDIWNNA